MGKLLFITLSAIIALVSFGAPAFAREVDSIEPDFAVQRAMDNWLYVVEAGPHTWEMSPFLEILQQDIMTVSGGDATVFLEQWLLWYAVALDGDEGSMMRLLQMAALPGKVSGLHACAVVTGLYPFLASGDVRIRTVAARVIKESESLDENWRPDFSCHTAILKEALARCGELPAGLVAYMFARDVERAAGALKTVDAEVPNKGDDGFSFERVLSEAGIRERR